MEGLKRGSIDLRFAVVCDAYVPTAGLRRMLLLWRDNAKSEHLIDICVARIARVAELQNVEALYKVRRDYKTARPQVAAERLSNDPFN